MCPWLMLVLNLEIVDHNVKRLLYLVLNLQNSDYMQPFLNISQKSILCMNRWTRCNIERISCFVCSILNWDEYFMLKTRNIVAQEGYSADLYVTQLILGRHILKWMVWHLDVGLSFPKSVSSLIVGSAHPIERCKFWRCSKPRNYDVKNRELFLNYYTLK